MREISDSSSSSHSTPAGVDEVELLRDPSAYLSVGKRKLLAALVADQELEAGVHSDAEINAVAKLRINEQTRLSLIAAKLLFEDEDLHTLPTQLGFAVISALGGWRQVLGVA